MSRTVIVRHGLPEKDGSGIGIRGKAATRLLALKLRRLGIQPEKVFASPDVFARETAYGLMDVFKMKHSLLREESILDCPACGCEVPFVDIQTLLFSEQIVGDRVVVLGDCLVKRTLVDHLCPSVVPNSPSVEILCGCALVFDHDLQSCVMVGLPTRTKKSSKKKVPRA